MSDIEFVDEAAALLAGISRLRGEDRIAAACRGSANPAALHWLAETLTLTSGELVADLGAGLGGPAEWTRTTVGCRVIAADPSPAAVEGAHHLFALETVQATAANAPFATDCFDAVLLLGVLSVVDDPTSVLREAHRIGRRVGVLDYCSATGTTLYVGGSRFPTADDLAVEVASTWEQVRIIRIDEPSPARWVRAGEEAHAGVPHPDSERDVVDAIEAGKLVTHALVAW